MAKKTFTIEWPDDFGPDWVDEARLKELLDTLAVMGQAPVTVKEEPGCKYYDGLICRYRWSLQ